MKITSFVLFSTGLAACGSRFSPASADGGSAGGIASVAGSSGVGGSAGSSGGVAGSSGPAGSAGTAGAPNDGECEASGLRVQMQPSSATQYVTSVVAAPTIADAFQPVCGQNDNIAASPVFACCAATQAVSTGTQICVDFLLGSLADPGITIDACAGPSTARCGDVTQYQFLLNGQPAVPRVVWNGSAGHGALCVAAP